MKNPKLNIIIIATLLPVSILVAVLFGVRPILNRLVADGEAFTDARIELAIIEQERQTASTLTRQFTKIQEDAALLTRSFVDANQALAFVVTLENIADQNGVIQDLDVAKPAAPAPSAPGTVSATEGAVELTVYGSYEALSAYLRSIETLPSYLSLSTLSLSPSGLPAGESTAATLALKASGKTLWLFGL